MSELPLIALTVGDPAGIGPELCRAALADRELLGRMRLAVLGPGRLAPAGCEVRSDLRGQGVGPWWVDTGSIGEFELGRPQAECGRAVLDALRFGARAASEGEVDALVTAPVSKEGLHLAGERVEGQTELLGRWAGASRFQMMAVAGPLRVMLLTRHMPILKALEQVTPERVVDHLALLDETLRSWGFDRPRLALAGFNPHAGEAGLLGHEDDERLVPAVARARSQGLDVSGPLPADSVFVRASRGAFDAVLALYHDQAFIPVKLAAPETSLTVIAGLGYLRISPAHGTAYDIAGTGRASPDNLFAALRQAAAWASGKALPAGGEP